MILVLGGARSGKSTFAEKKSTQKKIELKTNVMYVATSIGFDTDMKERIDKHKKSRDSSWVTLEKYRGFSSSDINEECQVIMLDCITLMISNLILESEYNFDTITPIQVSKLEKVVQEEVRSFLNTFKDKELIIVSNEVGLGIVPSYRLGAIFRDIAGRINQMIAREAQEVYFMIAGIEMRIK